MFTDTEVAYGLLGVAIFIMCITAPIGYAIFMSLIRRRK